MKPRILKIFKEICEINNGLIKKVDEIAPMCFLIKRDYNLTPILFKFGNHEEKIKLKNALKNFIIKQDILGYILIFDVKMTEVDTKGKKKPKVVDAVTRTLYTPKEKVMEIVKYRNKKILKTMKPTKKDMKKSQDEWDIWGKGIDEGELDKAGFDYGKFKMENPELYDGVVEQFEGYTQIKHGDTVVIVYKLDQEKKELRYNIPNGLTRIQEESARETMERFGDSMGKILGYKIIREVKK